MKYFLFLLMFLIGCGHRGNSASNTTNVAVLASIESQYEAYKELIATTQQDANGFVETNTCDSLLFSALLGSSGIEVNLEAARDDVGQWHRRPLSYTECYPGSSASTISKDQLLGLMINIWHNKRLDLAEGLYNYGVEYVFVYGQGPVSDVVMTPSMIATLCEIMYRLGGPDHPVERAVPQLYTLSNVGSPAHLDVLTILLRNFLVGSISATELEVVNTQFGREPTNALFAYAHALFTDGNYQQAADTLLNQSLFPVGRLPAASDRGVHYLWSVDASGWGADQGDSRVWAGVDFEYVAALILGK